MITFKDFLAEKIIVAPKVSELDIANAIKLLNKHCKNGLAAITNGGVIFRGSKSYANVKFGVVDSTSSFRTSRDTNNVYQIMMDSSSALVDYPRRSNSLVCSTDLDDASSYGSPMVVIPFDGTKIAISKNFDFLHVKPKNSLIGIYSGLEGLDNISTFIRDVMIEFCRKTKQKNPKVDIDSYEAAIIVNPEKFCDEWTYGFDLEARDSKKLRSIVMGSKTPFRDLSSTIMTPYTLDLKLVEFGGKLPFESECWFSGKCIIINPLVFAGILHSLKQQKAKVSSDLIRQLADYYVYYDDIPDVLNTDYIKNKIVGKNK